MSRSAASAYAPAIRLRAIHGNGAAASIRGHAQGECISGTTETFESARTAFLVAWAAFVSKRTEDDFDAWRQERDWTARKYAAWERGEKVMAR